MPHRSPRAPRPAGEGEGPEASAAVASRSVLAGVTIQGGAQDHEDAGGEPEEQDQGERGPRATQSGSGRVPGHDRRAGTAEWATLREESEGEEHESCDDKQEPSTVPPFHRRTTLSDRIIRLPAVAGLVGPRPFPVCPFAATLKLSTYGAVIGGRFRKHRGTKSAEPGTPFRPGCCSEPPRHLLGNSSSIVRPRAPSLNEMSSGQLWIHPRPT